MGNYSLNFYKGMDYGLDPGKGEYSLDLSPSQHYSIGDFGFTTLPTTANQLSALSSKLNTGAKTMEINAIQTEVLESIPKQHWKEIERLKKLTGVDLTLHGPLVEPSGIAQLKSGRITELDETYKKQIEKQMLMAMEAAHQINPKGNTVVTFHSSNGLPEPETVVVEEEVDPRTRKKVKKEKLVAFGAIQQYGQQPAGTIVPVEEDYFEGTGIDKDYKKKEKLMNEVLSKRNEEIWSDLLRQINFNVSNGMEVIEEATRPRVVGASSAERENVTKSMLESYKQYTEGKFEPREFEKIAGESSEVLRQAGLEPARAMDLLSRGDVYLRRAYQEFKDAFNIAYTTAQRTGDKQQLKKLEELRKSIVGKVKQYKNDPLKMKEFAATISKGLNILSHAGTPQLLKPLREYAIEKAADTFADVGAKAYKKFGKHTPIISIENPPAGMGLSRAEDLREIVETARKKLKEKLMREAKLSEERAEKEAKKLIGVTWDVGHINMIRKYGYEDKDVVKETQKIAPYVKHLHLSDNFGLEHTELPMGMGNVPIKPMLEAIEKYNKQMKKIVETGQWFNLLKGPTPIRETARAFGSPIYPMQMQPYWAQVQNLGGEGGYFLGYGQMLPEKHFSLYGASFSGLPSELSGQAGGGARQGRFSGAPME
ncbi:sugar phosphate isomerase/epimerase [Candidatus Pacearchaeota archaeon]|nr:MAG: sugar phosphate isomerase/epimerase [Candidatus Pacearchaeota archaeon]